jgi:2-polyprenyl-3-methyl-5-hydroxy-6-metoxy-1,4-benzoquinol methylase
VRYRFKGLEIRTENAAKPYRQRSKFIIGEISRISEQAIALDYGCGKFRYTIPLSRRVRHVCAVDSSYQIDREQRIANRRTNLREYSRRYLSNVSVWEVSSRAWRRKRFDFILCTNVLSVIPHKADRVKVLRDLKRVLRASGSLLVSTQYRNTHFKEWKTNATGTWVRDGWFVKGLHGATFYAIIPPKKLEQLCRAAGLRVIRLGSKGETAFVLAGASGP